MELEFFVIVVAAFLFAYFYHDQQVESFRAVRKSLISIDANLAEMLALLRARQEAQKQVTYLFILLFLKHHDLPSLGKVHLGKLFHF